MELFVSLYNSPVGELGIASSTSGLLRIDLHGKDHLLRHLEREFPHGRIVEEDAPNQEVIRQLHEYFTGKRREFQLKLHLIGTEFRKKVWGELQTIPFGKTVSYGELARRIGKPGAARAVGQANHFNPIPIVIPCHRVIGAGGDLTGFGAGLEMKEKLLRLERAI